MRKKTICWFIAAAKLIIFISYYGKDSVKADDVNSLLDSGTDEMKKYQEASPEIQAAEGSEAQKIQEGGKL